MGRVDASVVLNKAMAETGYKEGSSNYNKYAPVVGHPNYEPWCATFTTWAFKVGGQEIPVGTGTEGCWENNTAWKRTGRWSYYPAVGAVFFLGDAGEDHTGLVVRYDSTYIYTIEGNTGANGEYRSQYVAQHKRSRASIYGYGYPNYAHPIVSADPKWGGNTSGGTPPPPPPPAQAPLPRRNSSSPSAKPLQRLLKAGGYMPSWVGESDNYGPATQAAVVKFHRQHSRYSSGDPDPDIGRMGYTHLQTSKHPH